MLDQEKRIAAWRASMTATLGDKTDLIDELESHLREQLHRLALAGKPADQAWDLAVQQLGQPQLLAAEFGKIGPARPLRWAAAWLVFASYVVVGLVALSSVVWRRGDDGLLALHIGAVTMGYGAVLAFGALAIWSLLSRVIRGTDGNGVARLNWWAVKYCWAGLALSFIGVATGAFWANNNWGRFWNWDLKEIGGLAVVGWNAYALWQLGRSSRASAIGWIIGLTGNILVWFAWFGANLIEPGLFSSGWSNSFRLVLVAFLSMQVLLLGLALFVSAAARPKASSE
jgi:hypothetical protein